MEEQQQSPHTAITLPVDATGAPQLGLELSQGGVRTVQVVLLHSGAADMPDVLTYAVPAEWETVPAPGACVLAPLAGREAIGYVFPSSPEDAPLRDPARLRPLLSLLRAEPAFDARLARLLRWLAKTYRCAVADAMPLVAPERQGVELRHVVRLADWPADFGRIGIITRQVLGSLEKALRAAPDGLDRDALAKAVPAPNLATVLRKARDSGWVSEEAVLAEPRVRARELKGVRVVAAPNGETNHLGPRQREVLTHLAEQERAALQRDVVQELEVGSDVIRRLERRGLVQAERVAVRRAPALPGAETADTAPPLTAMQQAAADAIVAGMDGGPHTCLLFGVTGSGKTEVYLHAIQAARQRGRTAILLVPEISLTAQVAAAVRRRLGEKVAILHSALSDGERFDEWERLRSGEADVVVGPRSALFAPLRDPGLIILDEEHDGSYKQDGRTPRYHARDVAAERVRLSRGCLVLGSATPSLETFHAAQEGKYQLLELPERIQSRPLPTVHVVDLRAEMKARPGEVFGQRLTEAMQQRFTAGEQVILFLNRRGYSAFILCRDCGLVPECPNCNVSLTLHRQEAGRLLCHYCGHLQPAPTVCLRCFGNRLREFGLGTQRVETALRERFPRARVARMDRDTTARKGSHIEIIEQFRRREIDVLVGTQMVTKGFDFPGVTLVGVVTADVALHTPDFRASERAFQLLTQVAGRAGRGDMAGEVVVQTFSPEHPAIQAAAGHDFRAFYEQEIGERAAEGYPPFGSLARMVASHEDELGAEGRIRVAANIINECRPPEVEMLGPAPCPLSRLQNRYRWHLLLKSSSRQALDACLDACLPQIRRRAEGVVFDVDPVDLL